MVYRDWLCGLSPAVCAYVREISHKRRAELNPQMIALYETAQDSGTADFVAALELAAEQQLYGAEYVRAILQEAAGPPRLDPAREQQQAELPVPAQHEVERSLMDYEQYVANRECLRDVTQEPLEVGA